MYVLMYRCSHSYMYMLHDYDIDDDDDDDDALSLPRSAPPTAAGRRWVRPTCLMAWGPHGDRHEGHFSFGAFLCFIDILSKS